MVGRNLAMFVVTCECFGKDGKPFTIRSEEQEGVCPNCGREFRVRWSNAKTRKERFYALFGDYAKSSSKTSS